MDSLTQGEIIDIWGRVKKYVDTNKIKGKNQKEIESELDQMMAQAPSTKERGSMQTLQKKGFAKRAAGVQQILNEIPSYEKIEVAPPKKVKVKRVVLPKKVSQRAGQRLAIKTKARGTRVFSENQVNIARGQWKGRNAYWIIHKKLGFITWGLT